MRALQGGVPERPKGTGCKPVGSAYGGSNPPAPTHSPCAAVVLRRQYRSKQRPMAEPTSTAARRPAAAVAVLGLAMVASAVVRSILAWRHSVPRLFPDEYIYAAL